MSSESEEHTLIAIYNTRSGSQLAEKLTQLSSLAGHQVLPNAKLWCYDIRDQQDFQRGLDHIARQIQNASEPSAKDGSSELIGSSQRPARPACYILSCGGDGTIPAIVGALHDRHVPILDNPLAVFVVLPFGTANILARFVGWGSSMSPDYIDTLDSLVQDIIKAPLAQVDLMRVDVTGSKDTSHEEHSRRSSQGSRKSSKSSSKRVIPTTTNDETTTTATHYMILQACIGLEAQFGRFVEHHRTSSRVCNMLLSSFNVIRQMFTSHPHINRVISSIHTPTTSFSPTTHRSQSAIQLNIQNLPVAGGKDHSLWNWNSADPSGHLPVQKVDDGRVEVFTYPCKHRYLVNNFLAAWGRESDVQALGQIECPVHVVFDTSQKELAHTYVYIDGEYVKIRRPREMTVSRPGQITLAVHPDQSERVRGFVSGTERGGDMSIREKRQAKRKEEGQHEWTRLLKPSGGSSSSGW